MHLTQAKCALILKGLKLLMEQENFNEVELEALQDLHDDIMAESTSWTLAEDETLKEENMAGS